jgi:hypothetical protein
MGHAYEADMWHRTAPELATSYRVIRFGNRGAGRGSEPPAPCTNGRLVERPGGGTPAGSRLNDLDSQILALASTWITAEEAPASGFNSDSEMK